MRYKNVGSGPVKETPGNSVYVLDALDDRGETATKLTVLGGFDPCDKEPPNGLGKGKTFDACYVYLIPEGGGALASLEWEEVILGPGPEGKRFVWKP